MANDTLVNGTLSIVASSRPDVEKIARFIATLQDDYYGPKISEDLTSLDYDQRIQPGDYDCYILDFPFTGQGRNSFSYTLEQILFSDLGENNPHQLNGMIQFNYKDYDPLAGQLCQCSACWFMRADQARLELDYERPIFYNVQELKDNGMLPETGFDFSELASLQEVVSRFGDELPLADLIALQEDLLAAGYGGLWFDLSEISPQATEMIKAAVIKQ
ncbi:hypothetical protein AWM75_00635 [Aerococcus urinaehominis]|uniref:Uncharacterized protein n=1 Tax=Aerococcus urinaehominis TaxID=128944 RepID=A0A0X8FL18_9LACT|nr:hypothetical protein [Aerococcus urinaehominis]AMB98587.1 hypothetical protein AWM75_00635 [Aerococcus urinaehominis]SDL76782.1 hypothetical protein SAMN04487985_10118 [Aerococcus urinaehominis]